jgi:hypothetical protein
MILGEVLFWGKNRRDGADLSDVISNSLGSLATSKVQALTSDHFTKNTDDELVERLAQKLRIEPLVLSRAASKGSVDEIQMRTTNMFGESVTVTGLRIQTTVPFTGDAALWELKPSTYDLNPPRGVINSNSLVVGMEVRSDQQDSAINEIKAMLDSVERYIENQLPMIVDFNARIIAVLEPMVAARRTAAAIPSSLARKLDGI